MAQITFQQVVDTARKSLNDSAKDRYTDTALLGYANDGIDEMMMLRPDLFIGSFTANSFTQGAQFALGDNLPFPGRYSRMLADYVVARAELGDDEHVNSGRAVAMGGFFEKRLLT